MGYYSYYYNCITCVKNSQHLNFKKNLNLNVLQILLCNKVVFKYRSFCD